MPRVIPLSVACAEYMIIAELLKSFIATVADLSPGYGAAGAVPPAELIPKYNWLLIVPEARGTYCAGGASGAAGGGERLVGI